MPSPKISSFNSIHYISNSPHSLSHSGTHKSVHSAGSLAAGWPKKLSDFILRGGSPLSKNAGLTEQNLQEFNRRNAILETRYSKCSPYYKGLTDFSLVISREKLSGGSPERESQAGTLFSSGSKSSFAVRLQRWSTSCYTTKDCEKPSSSSLFWSKSSRHTHAVTAGSSSSKENATGMIITKIRTKMKKKDSESDWKKVSFAANRKEDTTSYSNKKPLRERQPEIPPSIQPPSSLPPILSQTMEDLTLASSPPLQPLPQPEQILPLAAAQTPVTEDIILKSQEINRAGNSIKFVWADSYRPLYLQDFICNRKKALWLRDLVKEEDCGHFIFEGLPGVGKKTMIWALLREAFGADNVQAREECKEFILKGEGVGSVLVNLMVSQQHIEVSLPELKGYEKHILFELIKEKSSGESNKALQRNHDCRAIILYEADKLSADTLTYIKWILEKSKGCNKVFFCCSDVSRLKPVKSLCTVVPLLPPSTEEIVEVLDFIAKKEGIQLPHQLAVKFANNSNNNLQQAIRSFEATWHHNSSLTEDQTLKTGWEEKIANLAANIIQEQTPNLLYDARGELQNLIEHAVAPELIFKTLVEELKKNLDEYLLPLFDSLCEQYNRNHEVKKLMASACAWNQQAELSKRRTDHQENVENFMRIEEFIAKFMSWYKRLDVKNK